MATVRITGIPTAEQDHTINELVRKHGLKLLGASTAMTLSGFFNDDVWKTLLRLTNEGLKITPALSEAISLLEMLGAPEGIQKSFPIADPTIQQVNYAKDYLRPPY